MLHHRRFALALTIALGVASAGLAGCGPMPPTEHPAVASATFESNDVEAEMRRVPVAMYMTTWCPVCRRARRWLQRGGYNYVEHDVERNFRAAHMLRSVNPRGSVPMFDVDGIIVIGFDPTLLRQALREAAGQRSSSDMGVAAPR